MTHITCGLTAKNPDQLRNPTLGNRVWATFTLFTRPLGYRNPFSKHCTLSSLLFHFLPFQQTANVKFRTRVEIDAVRTCGDVVGTDEAAVHARNLTLKDHVDSGRVLDAVYFDAVVERHQVL